MSSNVFKILPLGDQGILVQFKQEISEEVNKRVIHLFERIKVEQVVGIEEIIPTYSSLAIYYNPLLISYPQLYQKLSNLFVEEVEHSIVHSRKIVIPTLYGGKWGPDLEYVSRFNNLPMEDVVRIHSQTIYRVYMLGFTPGFPYLGGLSPQIHTPRLEVPRTIIPAGSVGIAGEQTGIYSLSTPGGWQLIGHTPIRLFDIQNINRPFLLQPGDQIQFQPIEEMEHERIMKQVSMDEYRPVISS